MKQNCSTKTNLASKNAQTWIQGPFLMIFGFKHLKIGPCKQEPNSMRTPPANVRVLCKLVAQLLVGGEGASGDQLAQGAQKS